MLVYADKWDTARPLELRSILDRRYGGQEPELVKLDIYSGQKKSFTFYEYVTSCVYFGKD